jgi:uncharacterized protein
MAKEAAPALGESIEVALVYSPAPRIAPAGSRVADALNLAWRDARFAPAQADHSLGLWNRKVRADHVLQDGDRIELYRPLRVDPKVARRERFQKQGARSAGLFATRRPGAKPGY